MKQLTCEMCGSTEMMKQDGVFVCQSCGTKYSVEEAKKMMTEGTVEVVGAKNVQNSAQVSSLFKLAQISFDSENYSQTEGFCNQIIALDELNYEAWKLKGEAINYQITTTNPRILEAYNCFITAYNVLSDEEKDEKRAEILKTISTCFDSEIDLWLDNFEDERPTNENLAKVKASATDAVNKIEEAYKILGLDSTNYIDAFINTFILAANAKVLNTWKSTVAYNFYRDDLANYGASWYETYSYSDCYRPTREIFTTFVSETDNLISLLEFCVNSFTETTTVLTRSNIYNNMIFYNTKLIEAKCYKAMVTTTTNGYGAVTDRREHWDYDTCLSDNAKEYRRNNNNKWEKERVQEIKNYCEIKSYEELMQEGDELLSNGDGDVSEYFFEVASTIAPEKALPIIALVTSINDQNKEINEELLLSASTKILDDAEKEKAAYYIENEFSSGVSLFRKMCGELNFEAVEFFVNLGVDIDIKSETSGATGLWLICHDTLKEDQKEDARKIAKLLLDNGASIEVTNKGGVALFNDKTDHEIANMILEKYPEAQRGDAPASRSSSTGGGGCYVATAVYGSYDCPEVWTLRRYRDNTLASTWYGRAFIRTYYAISPTLVKWFGHTDWFKKMWQGKLDKMVEKLQSQGVESTPYEDKNW